VYADCGTVCRECAGKILPYFCAECGAELADGVCLEVETTEGVYALVCEQCYRRMMV
jgi:DNA-directed RNA polymerase subunit RPC12/RpoP